MADADVKVIKTFCEGLGHYGKAMAKHVADMHEDVFTFTATELMDIDGVGGNDEYRENCRAIEEAGGQFQLGVDATEQRNHERCYISIFVCPYCVFLPGRNDGLVRTQELCVKMAEAAVGGGARYFAFVMVLKKGKETCGSLKLYNLKELCETHRVIKVIRGSPAEGYQHYFSGSGEWKADGNSKAEDFYTVIFKSRPGEEDGDGAGIDMMNYEALLRKISHGMPVERETSRLVLDFLRGQHP